MKTMLLILLSFTIVACNGEGGGGSNAQAIPVLDSRLFEGNGRWYSYDPVTNIDDEMVFTSNNNQVWWDSRYRGGSAISNETFALLPTTSTSLYAEDITDPADTYEFDYEINGSVLTLCQGAACWDFYRTPIP